jgi:ABC-type oligopeptide transport system ATPase subunit
MDRQTTPIIEMKDVKKYFSLDNGFFTKGKRFVKAVNDVTLSINQGEIVGLVGESGSGKTTLARVILNLTKLTGGSVVMDGTDMAKASRGRSINCGPRWPWCSRTPLPT